MNQSLAELNIRQSKLFKDAIETNENVVKSIVADVLALRPKGTFVGTSFKSYPETSDTRASHTLEVVRLLDEASVGLKIYDHL